MDHFCGFTIPTENRHPEFLYGRSIGANTVTKLKSGATDFANPKELGAGSYALLRNPYTASMLIRFEEAWRMDPVVRSGINRKVSYTLGKKFYSIFQLIDDLPNKKVARQALSTIASKQEWQNAKKVIDRLNRNLGLQEKLKAAVIQAKVYGRSGLLLDGALMSEGFPTTQITLEDIPNIDMKVLNAKLMGQVRIDENTWKLQSLLYNTNNRGLNDPSNFLLADRLIYFTNLDHHISPFTYRYGYSDIEPIAHISECNRIMNEQDLKEINFSQWSGFGLIKVPGTRNIADVNNFLTNFKGGRWSVISSELSVEMHNFINDLNGMLNERDKNEQLILRTLNVPSMILGFEDIQNYATAQQVLMAWKESVLEEERTWLKDIIGPQWFDRLLCNILQMDPHELDALITLEFEDIAFENMKDKAIVVLPLFEAGLLSPERVLQAFGFDDAIDDLQELQAQKQKMQDQMNKQTQDNNNPNDVTFPSTSGRSLLKDVQKSEGQPQDETTAAEDKLL